MSGKGLIGKGPMRETLVFLGCLVFFILGMLVFGVAIGAVVIP